jgi:biopolymer transport protein TolR
MSKVFKRGPAKAEANMTPLIDVTFQLIIFFLLVNQIVAVETEKMLVPELSQPKTRELGEVDRVTVNIAPMDFDVQTRQPVLAHEGRARLVKIGMYEFAVSDTVGIAAFLAAEKLRNPEIEILLRADAALYYDAVQPVMAAITQAGISTVNLVAYLPDQGPTLTRGSGPQ